MQFITFPGIQELTGSRATVDDVAATLAPLQRDNTVHSAIRLLNKFAYDRNLEDDQRVLIEWLEPALLQRYREFEEKERADDSDTILRPFHPYQQLMLLHAAGRYCGGQRACSETQAKHRLALACLQINDLILKSRPETRRSTVLYLFSENGPTRDLFNNSHPLRSLARLRTLLIDMATRDDKYGLAAVRLRDRFQDYVGLDFTTVFNLTGFLIFWWYFHVEQIPRNPDANVIDRRTWLERSSIAREQMDAFLDRLSVSVTQLVHEFDVAGLGMTFSDVMPFRQRSMFRIDENRLAFICPQFVAEKGGIDLFWLLTNQTRGVKEERPWTDDFGELFEGYVDDVLSHLPPAALGGHYHRSVEWRIDASRSGEIDGLIRAGSTLILIESKGSLLREAVLSRGTEAEVREEIEKKFFVGLPGKPKEIIQLVRAMDWLSSERRRGRAVRNIDLREIDAIIPLLVVADRSLRFPPLARWFDRRFRLLLKSSWGRIGPLVLCSIEDLEVLEQQATEGSPIAAAITEYADTFPEAQQPITAMIRYSRRHSRLDKSIDRWMSELIEQHILPER